MKTSNKILVFIGLTLLVSPFINAYSLRQKLVNKEYTLLKDLDMNGLKPVALLPTDSVHIIGGNNLAVGIIQSDSASIEIGEKSAVLVYEENGVLTIQYSEDHNSGSRNPPFVIIKTPSIKAISFEGKLIEYSTGTKHRKTATSYYSPFDVTIEGFDAEQMNIHGIRGGGSVIFNNTSLDKLFLSLGEMSNFKIDERSRIDSMNIKALGRSSISFNGTHVNSLKTKLDSTASLTFKGSNIPNIIPYQ